MDVLCYLILAGALMHVNAMFLTSPLINLFLCEVMNPWSPVGRVSGSGSGGGRLQGWAWAAGRAAVAV